MKSKRGKKIFTKRVKDCLLGNIYFITLKNFIAKQFSNLELRISPEDNYNFFQNVL